MEELNQCRHDVFLEGKCANCKKLKLDCEDVATVPINYLHPGVSMSLATTFIDRFRDQDLRNTLGHKKLSLILDLDNTLIHAKRKKKLSLEDKQRVAINKVYQNGSRLIKLRPGVGDFVKEVGSMFDLSIYTMGDREYAHDMAKLLASDSNGDVRSVFGRIIGREDCTKSKEKGLDIFVSHKRVVLIVDDKEDVWEESCKGNVIKIEPYYFFSDRRKKKNEGCNNNGSDDETGMDEELKRVLGTLRAVHTMFYKKTRNEDYMKKDVREILERVRVNEVKLKEEEEEWKKRKREEDEKNRIFIEKFCSPLKKYKTDVPFGGSIHV